MHKAVIVSRVEEKGKMDIVKITVVGISGVLLALMFQNGNKEYTLLISISTGIIIFFYALTRLSTVVETMQELQSLMNLNENYSSLFLKMIGITYISEFSSNICRDAGFSGVGKQIEIFGKLCIFVVSLSVINSLIHVVNEILIA